MRKKACIQRVCHNAAAFVPSAPVPAPPPLPALLATTVPAARFGGAFESMYKPSIDMYTAYQLAGVPPPAAAHGLPFPDARCQWPLPGVVMRVPQ